MSAKTWATCDANEHAEFGVRYRSAYVFHEYTFAGFGAGVRALLPKSGQLLSLGRIRVIGTEFYGPGNLPADMQKLHKPNSWGVRVTWEKIAEGTPVVVYAGAIIAVMLAATFLWIIAAKTTEKEIHQLFEDTRGLVNDIKNAAQETLFNPGLIVAAVVVAALVLKRR